MAFEGLSSRLQEITRKTRKMEKCYFSKTGPTNNMDTKKFSRKVEKC